MKRRALRRRYGRARRPSVGQVVVAWRSDSSEAVDPHLTRVDLGERHKLRPIIEGKAVMWARHGNAHDISKAEAYAHSETVKAENDPWRTGYDYRVFVYPTTEKDPLGRARREIVK
jgi:hypothetical protein